jgi:hypothetical protein
MLTEQRDGHLNLLEDARSLTSRIDQQRNKVWDLIFYLAGNYGQAKSLDSIKHYLGWNNWEEYKMRDRLKYARHLIAMCNLPFNIYSIQKGEGFMLFSKYGPGEWICPSQTEEIVEVYNPDIRPLLKCSMEMQVLPRGSTLRPRLRHQERIFLNVLADAYPEYVENSKIMKSISGGISIGRFYTIKSRLQNALDPCLDHYLVIDSLLRRGLCGLHLNSK